MQTRNKIVNIVKKFKKALIENGYDIDKVYLYGSQAYGKPHEDSDIDVMVFSEDITKNMRRYNIKMNMIADTVDDRMEVLAYNPKLVDPSVEPLVYVAMTKGIEI